MQRRGKFSRNAATQASPPLDVKRRQLGWHLRNCVLRPAAGLLERAMLGRLGALKGGAGCDDPEFPEADEGDGSWSGGAARGRSRLRQLQRVLEGFDALPRSGENLERNALFARGEFGLDAVDTDILLLLLRYERNGALEQFADAVLQRLQDPARAVAALLGIEPDEARRRIAAGGPLIAAGLVCLDEDGRASGWLAGRTGYLQPSPPLRKVIHARHDSAGQMIAAIVGEP